MKAILLAGGLGTRLRPLTFAIPKPLIPVGNRPILEILIENLSSHGVKDIYLALGYRADLFHLYFQDGSKFGVNIHYSEEEKRLGTAGPVQLVRDRFGIVEAVFVLNADIITQVNFRHLHAWHHERQSDITVGIRRISRELPYGVVEMEGDDIRSIVERPEQSHMINCGIYVIEPKTLDLVPAGEPFTMPELIQAAKRNGMRVCGYPIREKWVAIEDMEDLEQETRRIGWTASD